jgi:anti-sigma B factor antagonist
MEITVLESGPLTVVAIGGSVDGMTAGALTDALAELVKGGRNRMVADFAGVDYISSAGLRALLGAMKDARHAGFSGWHDPPDVSGCSGCPDS